MTQTSSQPSTWTTQSSEITLSPRDPMGILRHITLYAGLNQIFGRADRCSSQPASNNPAEYSIVSREHANLLSTRWQTSSSR
ncbi:hypothetical protein BAUCODRAFT_127473 [Baudoinia panamericana UAMH 10762]|uniref:Uncharacterized protein n=1 Tax=Baudoinia panamericana (strain UAMH 10762) TaxID=717646 RepID=M2M361_BAUPA|nr:uncharacterized protein BAUCODRAFT_127473 [Baudoinia panamericana UAMH 10762]EMC90976.1 hypothetical protein BAUCODRAFT_127473 [Baudoinia panamericana UAMH 10762]